MNALFAVECRSSGYPCWCTIATERTRKAANSAMKAVRHLMPTAQHRGTLQVARYTRIKGQWVREGGTTQANPRQFLLPTTPGRST